MRRSSSVLIAVSLLALAACDRDATPEAVDTRPQPVLEGTVSDAMLYTDQLRVPAPIADPVATGVPEEAEEPGDQRPARRRDRGGEGEQPDASPTPDATGEPAAAPKASPTPEAKAPAASRPSPSPTP